MKKSNMSSDNRSSYQDEWERSPGYVYFIGAGDPVKAVKIGVTKQKGIIQMLRHHQTSNHEPLRILAVIPFEATERPMLKAEEKEKELRTKFAHLQRFKSGWIGSEWFTVSDDLLAEIDKIGIKPKELGIKDSVIIPGPGLDR